MYTQTTQTMTVAVGDFAKKQADAGKASEDLAFKQKELTAKINTQNAAIQEQKQRIIQMADGLDKNTATAKLEQMQVALEGMQRDLTDASTEQGNLNKATQEYATVTKTSWQQVMNMNEAQALAKKQTEELTGFVEKLAILSPFEQEDVEKITQYALGAGLAVDTTEKFTKGFLDLGAALGMNSPALADAAFQLLQVKKAGKLTEVDLKQLSTRGIDLAKIIGIQMGMSVDEFNKKAEQSPAIFDQLIDAVTEYSQNTFAGTSEAMSTSLEGLRSTVSDLFTQSAKKMLRPLVDAVSPTMVAVVGKITDFVTGGQMEAIGQQLADAVMTGLNTLTTSVGKIFGAFSHFGIRGGAVSIMGQLGFSQESIAQVTSVISTITGAFDKIKQAYQRFGAKGATVSIMGILGLDPTTIGTIFTSIDSIIQKITTLQSVYQQFGAMGAGISLMSMLGFSSETIGQITVAIDSIVEKIGILQAIYQQFGAMGAGVSLLSMLGLSSETIGTITTIIQGVVDTFTSLWSFVTSMIVPLFSGTIPEALQPLVPTFQRLGEGVMGFFQNLAPLGPMLLELMPTIKMLAELIGAGLLIAIEALAVALPQVGSIIAGVGEAIIRTIEGITMILHGQMESIIGLFTLDFERASQGGIEAVQGMVTVIAGIVGGLETAMESILGGAVDRMIYWFDYAYEAIVGHSIVPDLVNGVIKWFSQLGSKITSTLGDLGKIIIEPFVRLGTAVNDEVGPALSKLGEDVFPVVSKGLDLIAEAVRQLQSAWNALSKTASDFANNIPDVLMPGSPPPLAYAMWDISEATQDASDSMKDYGNVGRQAIQRIAAGAGLKGGSIKDAIGSSFGFSARMFKGLDASGEDPEGILSEGERNRAEASIKKTYDTLYGSILKGTAGAMDFTKMFHDQLVGAMNQKELDKVTKKVSGMAQGIVDGIRSQFGPMSAELKAQAVGLASSFNSLGQGFADMLSQQIDVFNKAGEAAAKLGDQNKSLTAKLGDQQKQMDILQAELTELTSAQELDTTAIDKKKLAIEKLSAEMDKNRQTIEDNKAAIEAHQKQLEMGAMSGLLGGKKGVEQDLARIELLKKFLAGNEQILSFTQQVAAEDGTMNTVGLTWDRVDAQTELNKLLKEQADREAEIKKQQEAQQQLDFLQKQVELIKLGQSIGGDVFKGLTFGLNASVDDMLKATNQIVAAMVGSIDQQLGIASPSKVMFKKFKDQVGGGMVRGLLAARPMLEGVISPMMNPLINGGGVQNNKTYNFYQTVNTRAEQSSVIGDFRTMQLMIGS